MGGEGNFETAYATRAVVGEVITAGRRGGVFSDEEHRMPQRLLRFRNRIVKETMVPRRDLVAVAADPDVDAAFDTCLDAGFTELPVYEDVLDTVVGTVHLLDLIDARERGKEASLRSVASVPYVVPESKRVDEFPDEMRVERRRMAIVVDEFGATTGVVVGPASHRQGVSDRYTWSHPQPSTQVAQLPSPVASREYSRPPHPPQRYDSGFFTSFDFR
jgi:putative hemolysin